MDEVAKTERTTMISNPFRSQTNVLLCLMLVVLAVSASAQPERFPSRPITIFVPFTPGGGSDPVIRLIGSKFAESTGQPVIIDSRPGGGGNIGALAAKQANPDGYTLFLGNMSTHAINVSLYQDLRFDPIKDFQPITLLFAFPSALLVPANLPAMSVAELATMARAKPGGLSYASQGVGSGGHILGELLSKSLGVPMTHVPYRGAAPAITDLMAGRVDFMFGTYPSAGAQVRGGHLRILAMASSKRSNLLPDVPTMADVGFPGMELDYWAGLLAPAQTPAGIVRQLNEEFVKAAQHPDVRRFIAQQGAEIVTSTPGEFSALIRADIMRLGKIVRESGATAQ